MSQCYSVSLFSNVASSESFELHIQDGNPRNKTALAPGHSVMDWIRLGNSGVDLTGVGGIPRTVTLTELANHNKQNDAWIAIRGIVFNVTRYMDFHPGGIDELMKGVGKDATKLFDNVHAWVNYQSLLQKCVVGRLSRPTASNLSKTIEKSSIANDLLKSCATQRKSEEEIGSDLSKIKMDWRQTSNTITLFYQTINDYQGIYYRISRINDTKLVFNLSFEKDIVIHELELAGEIEWPPAWNRNYESMEVDFTFRKKDKTVWKTQGSHTLSREPITNKRVYKEYEVLSNTPLCKSVNLLVLRAKDSLELIPSGRHLEAKMKIAGVEISRYYTPVPACLHPEDTAPNYTSDCICLMIKQYEDGALSPSITALKVKEKVTLSNGLGVFVVESFDRYSVVHMLAAGTGLTAMLGIIQRSLARRNVYFYIYDHPVVGKVSISPTSTKTKITCSTWSNWRELAKQISWYIRTYAYGISLYLRSLIPFTIFRLKVTHILSQPSDSWKGRRGTMSDELLKELIGDCSPHSCVFVCGPKGFLVSSRKCLRNLDWKSYQMYEFDD
ncbi:hypothetical protein HZH66_014099 [Vespula vulgaris]|uniref:Cytochrome b5 heme-binding domain-containing protein n=1 Tax=Vespula vulgaris TaxID=7454 RepID=A0A834J2T5_VESVU|nr:hypothetical protein HZH66_014099 [Vespula vulgaris]